jgi:uncharacterized phage-associated protein
VPNQEFVETPMPYDARIIANAILQRAARKGLRLTNLDIQKLVYLVHGAFLQKTGKPLVEGEFEAWQYGPVHRVLYNAFRSAADGPIDGPARKLNPLTRTLVDLPRLDDPEVEDVLDSNLGNFLSLPTHALVQLTHAPGTPWSRTFAEAETRPNVGMVISDSVIALHFEGHRIREFSRNAAALDASLEGEVGRR